MSLRKKIDHHVSTIIFFIILLSLSEIPAMHLDGNWRQLYACDVQALACVHSRPPANS
jgi:hypothetical protein